MHRSNNISAAMEQSPNTPAKATTSCRRCNRRKKKCDRALPECEMCCNANVACSFLANDRQVGSYPVAYVQNLENRVKELERLLASTSFAVNNDAVAVSGSLHQFVDVEPHLGTFEDSHAVDGDLNTVSVSTVPAEDVFNNTSAVQYLESSDTLEEGLKLLSLEAAAERYLGSSAGLSFAKLTQSLLRQLPPDKADLTFAQDQDSGNDAGQALNDEPFNLFIDPAVLLDWNNSPQYSPSLFGELSLSALTDSETNLSDLKLPEKSYATHLTNFYFAHSHTLYPIIHRSQFLSVIRRVYADPQNSLNHSPLWLFRIWMVLAVGSTAYQTVSLIEESESVLYYNKAMSYFETAFAQGDMIALEVLMLQVSYSFFNQIGPNTWFLVGVAARLAIGMGLHTSATYSSLPADVAEHRRRVFHSLYMMDRVVSIALGRPFAIHDQDVDVEPFTAVDDENIEPSGIKPQSLLQPSIMTVPLHILALRRIASEIAEKVYSKNNIRDKTSAERDDIIAGIHKKLIIWRRDMPFPLQDINSKVPHLCSSWFDLNYQTHMVRLYRPSPLCPTPDDRKLRMLATASTMAIRETMNLHRQQRLAYNWLSLLSLFSSTMALIYTTTVQPEDLSKVLRQSTTIDDLESATSLFDVFAKKFSVARKIWRLVKEIQRRFEDSRAS